MDTLPEQLRFRLDARGRDLRVLVIRTGALGDILRTLPPVRLVRSALPEARIDWVADDRWCGILEGHPDLNGVVPVPRAAWRHGLRRPLTWRKAAGSLGGFVRSLRAVRADLVLDFHGNLRSGLIGLASGAPVRVGYAGHQQKEGNRFFTTHRVPSGPRRISRMERNLDIVRALGIPDAPLADAGLEIGATARASARRVLDAAGRAESPHAIVVPGASARQSYKKPPAPLLASAIRALADRGIAAIVVHGPGEQPDADSVVRESEDRAILAPPTDLPTLAALLQSARLLVAGDTGPLHLACAVGCPAVAVYGPTDPVVNAPWGVPYRCVSPPGRTYTGIKRLDREAGGFEGIAPSAVEEAVKSILDETDGQRGGVPGPRVTIPREDPP